MKKKIIEITSIQELMEMSMSGGGVAGHAGHPAPKRHKQPSSSSSSGQGQANHFKPKGKDMRKDLQTEMMMRQYIRNKIKKQLWEQKKYEEEQEHKLRLVIRGLIKEAKEMANPHPNTGINKLRDAFRKAKPTLKTKYQQLTSTPEQRETFTSHMLSAFVRLFDELDALQAQGDVEDEIQGIEAEAGGEPEQELEAPPGDEEIEDELESLLESILKEVEVSIDNDDDMDIVSDDEKEEEEKQKSQAEKDFDKKKEGESEKQEFGAGLDGDTTGRNQAFDAFRLVQSYFSDAYLDLANEEDQKMYRDWCLYNMKLLFKNFEESLPTAPEQPNIENPEGV